MFFLRYLSGGYFILKGGICLRSVLDSPSQRQIKIIEILSEANEWVTTGKLALDLGVAAKTITDDVKIIREEWGEELKIESSFVYGIRINQSSTSILTNVFSDIFNQSMSVKWIKLIFYFPYKDLNFYADKLHVSQSTLYRLFTKINNSLNKYHIHLKRCQSVYYFSADNETVFRKFMTAFLIDVAGGDLLKIMTEDIMLNLETRITEKVLGIEIKENSRYLYYFIVFYYTSLYREGQGFNLSDVPPKSYATNNEAYLYACSLSGKFPRVKKEYIDSIEGDISFHFNGWENAEEREKVDLTLNSFVTDLFKQLDISFCDQQFAIFVRILKSIYIDEKNYAISYSVLFDRFSYFSAKFQQEKAGLYHYLIAKFERLSQSLKLDFTTRIDLIVYWLVTSMPQVLMYRLPQKILVISDFSESHADFIAEVLTNNLSAEQDSEILFDYIAKDELTKADLNNYQLFVSNCLLADDQLEVVLIDDYPTYQDIFRVNQQLSIFK